MNSARTIGLAALVLLVTGANSGLGLELVKQYAAKGWTVIATHRRDGVPDTLAAVVAEHPNVRVERMDVESAAEIKALADKLRGVPVDVLGEASCENAAKLFNFAIG